MAYSVDPDQTAPSGAVWSGSALFEHAILSGTLVYEILGHLSYFIINTYSYKMFACFTLISLVSLVFW